MGWRLGRLKLRLGLRLGRLKLLDGKRQAYVRHTREMAARPTSPRAELVSLLGRLGFAACCFPRGRQWLNASWRAVRAQFRLHDGGVVITSAVKVGLLRWAKELEAPGHEGLLLASPRLGAVGEPGVGAIYADASGDIGYCAWTVHEGELLYVLGVWNTVEWQLPIHHKELIASTLGLW